MKYNPSKLKTALKAKAFVPTPHETAVLKNHLDRKKSEPPRLKVRDDDGKFEIELDHPKKEVGLVLLMEAIGAKDVDFLCGFLEQLSNAGTQGRTTDGRGLNFMLSVVKSIEPKDQIEAMLAAQMAAVHMATMTFARRLAHVDNIAQQDSAERAFNKLARTFASQMEALNRYRGKGQQKVTVEHVHVHDGGQAVVGAVEIPGGGGQPKSKDQPHAKQIAHAPQPAVWSSDKEREPVPIAGDAERPLSDARRDVAGSTEGKSKRA